MDRRPGRSGPRVMVEVDPTVAELMKTLTPEDVRNLKRQRGRGRRSRAIFLLLDAIVALVCLALVVYIFWDPFWQLRQTTYEMSVRACVTSATEAADGFDLPSDWKDKVEQKSTKMCEDMLSSLRPPSQTSPDRRAKFVMENITRPIRTWLLKTFFLPDPEEDPGWQTVFNFTELADDELGNPSPIAVAQKALELEKEFNVPAEYVFNMCYYESGGFNHYSSAGVLTQGDNGTSIDWGLCQINDKYNSDLMTLAKGTWQDNLRASFTVASRQCSSALSIGDSEQKSRALYGCYNGSGPNGVYADRVINVERSGLWEQTYANLVEMLDRANTEKKNPVGSSGAWAEYWSGCGDIVSANYVCGFPLPNDPNQYIRGTTANGGKGLHEGACDYWNASKTSEVVYNIVPNGTVTQQGRYNNGGNGGGTTYTVVSNGKCTATYYHFQENYVAQNAKVEWGQPIGLMGNEGQSAWIHLHLSIDCGAGPELDHEQYWKPYMR